LQAIRLADKSWRNVSQQTIINCFKICGFSLQKENFEEQSGPVINHSVKTEWSQVLSHYNIQSITFEDFVECDDDVLVTELLTDTEIIETITQTDEDKVEDIDDEELFVMEPQVSINQARKTVNVLRSFIKKCNDIEDNVYSSLVIIENVIDQQCIKSLTQSKITDFLNTNE